jgi:serine protease AprX
MTARVVRWGRCTVLVAGLGLLAAPSAIVSTATADVKGPTSTSTGKIVVLKDQWGDDSADAASKGVDGSYRADKDPGSLFTITRAIGARKVWGRKDANGRAITGQGITVALLDSGLAPVAGLNSPGKLVQGPDLSLENENPALLGLDTFGHGTHLGGIIAASDATPRDPKTGSPTDADPDQQLGVAPDAKLLGLKLATANGSTDVSQVIAGLDWVSQHQHDNGLNVRVVNLSFGTDSLQPYQLDPLAAAAENAWHHGIVVVVSGGNEGQNAGRLTDPAMDPYVIAVGASDANLSVKGWRSPTVAAFSNSGTEQRHVDLVAPGKSLTSLRDPGSFIDTSHPEGLVSGDTSGRLFRGSGTSQAAAVVSGAAALLLQANPALTPDQVKAALTSTANPIDGTSPLLQGAGELDVAAAVDVVRPTSDGSGSPKSSLPPQTFDKATGTGSIEAARGGSNLIDLQTGDVLNGEVDAQGLPFDSALWAASSSAGAAWIGGVWNGAQWTGDTWDASLSAGSTWLSARWSSARWSSARWSSARWSDAVWSSARWSSARWSDADWSSARWSSARWSDAGWDSARWSSARWSDSSWA